MDLRTPTKLGRSGLRVSRIGLGSSYGIGAADVERAFDRGINYFYWGSVRRPSFGKGVRTIAQRDRASLVVCVQTYTRAASLMRGSIGRAVRKLGCEYADLLLLGWWNEPPPARIRDAAIALREEGLVRQILVSCHKRATFAALAAEPAYGAIMVRYSAAHSGAETDVFPHLGAARPGVVAYTTTRWGQLCSPRHTPAGERTPRASDCYRFALAHPSVDACLAGPKNSEELDEALAALERGPMDADEIAWMRRVGAAVRSVRMPAGVAGAVGVFDRLRG